MAWNSYKLLNHDGTLMCRIGNRDKETLVGSGRATVFGSKGNLTVKLKELPDPSLSERSSCTPTTREIAIYTEWRNCPEEIKVKIDAFQPLFNVVMYEEIAA